MKMRNRFGREDTMSWFFRVVFPKLFLVMFALIIAWFLFIGYMLYTVGNIVVDDPAAIGRMLGNVAQGYQDTVNQ